MLKASALDPRRQIKQRVTYIFVIEDTPMCIKDLVDSKAIIWLHRINISLHI